MVIQGARIFFVVLDRYYHNIRRIFCFHGKWPNKNSIRHVVVKTGARREFMHKACARLSVSARISAHRRLPCKQVMKPARWRQFSWEQLGEDVGVTAGAATPCYIGVHSVW